MVKVVRDDVDNFIANIKNDLTQEVAKSYWNTWAVEREIVMDMSYEDFAEYVRSDITTKGLNADVDSLLFHMIDMYVLWQGVRLMCEVDYNEFQE